MNCSAATAPPVRPVLGVSAAIREGENFLLIRRRNPPNAGLWAFPGGKIEAGETLSAAAAREVLEETGIVAAIDRLVETAEIFFRDADGGLLGHYVLMVHAGRRLAGDAVAATDAAEAGFFSLAEAEALPLTPETARILRKLAAE